MNKRINTFPNKISVKIEAKKNYNNYLPPDSTGYSKHPIIVNQFIPEGLRLAINELINNQNEIIDKLELILKSNIGKAIIGLEPFPDKEEKDIKV